MGKSFERRRKSIELLAKQLRDFPRSESLVSLRQFADSSVQCCWKIMPPFPSDLEMSRQPKFQRRQIIFEHLCAVELAVDATELCHARHGSRLKDIQNEFRVARASVLALMQFLNRQAAHHGVEGIPDARAMKQYLKSVLGINAFGFG